MEIAVIGTHIDDKCSNVNQPLYLIYFIMIYAAQPTHLKTYAYTNQQRARLPVTIRNNN